MAQANIGSRRECEKMIAAGQVKVNGRVATLGDKAEPGEDRVEVRGRLLDLEQYKKIYVAINKPKGVISSLSDELDQGRKTVRDLVPLPGHLYPVGRLDKQSTGLMLMTNDGTLAHKLTHPRYGHEKTYRVTLEGKISQEALELWAEGVWLDDKKTAPARVKIIRQEKEFTLIEIVMREGRKRQIRRVASMLGHPVTHLVREKIGPIQLGSLKLGDWRYLSDSEVKILKKTVARKKARRRPPKKRRPRKNKNKNSTRKDR